MEAALGGHKEVVQILQPLVDQVKRAEEANAACVAHAPEVAALLESVSWTKYCAKLLDCDYTSIAYLKEATASDLQDCGISPRARRQIMKAAGSATVSL